MTPPTSAVQETEERNVLVGIDAEPPEQMELVDGQLIEKTGMTLRHGQVQLRLGFYWRGHMIANSQGGEVFTEVSCRTDKQIRRPDVSYVTSELLKQSVDASVVPPTLPAVLPQSFPLIAEVASPDDKAEELFAKAAEYLRSGGLEVWLIFPDTFWVIILTQETHCLLTLGEIATTQKVLLGFSVPVDELLGFALEGVINGQDNEG